MNNDKIQCSIYDGQETQKGRLKACSSSPGTNKREPKEAWRRGVENEDLPWRKPCIVWTSMLKWVFGGGLPCEAEHWGKIGRMPTRVKGPAYAETQSMSGSDRDT